MVPVPHRRWAKGFIQSWRKENLKNATTTTSDSDGKVDWKISMADAGVPQAYAEWLELKLFRWHKKWSSDDINEMEVEGDHKKMDKKANKGLKASVPKEFRQWTKRYLNTHFCRRDAPKFKKHHNGWKSDLMENKKNGLYAMVPREYRLWTKKFIRDWRIEKKLDNPNSDEPLPNNSEDNGTDMDTNEMVSIPEEYKQWLDKFLLRWHIWRGQLERNPDVEMKRSLGQFKDSVPMEYRTWVKHYLCVHYNKPNKHNHIREVEVDPSQAKYEKMLQAFQKKWMDKKSLSTDHGILLYTSSSDEETNQGEPESSFKRLSLSNDNGCKKSKVSFEDTSDLGKAKRQKTVRMEDFVLLMDSDDYDDDNDNDDGKAQLGKVPMNPSFRHWTKQALYDWDGETVGEANNSQRDGDEEINLPPNVYQWMSKMMMKMQRKKMKQQFKAAKREMKAVKKELKHGKN